jgi:hypothetical protein
LSCRRGAEMGLFSRGLREKRPEKEIGGLVLVRVEQVRWRGRRGFWSKSGELAPAARGWQVSELEEENGRRGFHAAAGGVRWWDRG